MKLPSKMGRNTRTYCHLQMHRKLRNHVNCLQKRLKSQHFYQGFREAGKPKRSLSSVSQQFCLRYQIRKESPFQPVQADEVLNKRFETIGQKIVKTFVNFNRDARGRLRKKTDMKFQTKLRNKEFIKIQQKNLKTNQAVGLEKISARLLKDSADIIAYII